MSDKNVELLVDVIIELDELSKNFLGVGNEYMGNKLREISNRITKYADTYEDNNLKSEPSNPHEPNFIRGMFNIPMWECKKCKQLWKTKRDDTIPEELNNGECPVKENK